MQARDLGPYAVFRFQGRVYVKSAGMIQLLDRSGQFFEGTGSLVGRLAPDDEVEPFSFAAPLPGSACTVCYGSGYFPGGWDGPLHGVTRRIECPNGCAPEYAEPPKVNPYVSRRCECCQQPLPECKTPEKVSPAV